MALQWEVQHLQPQQKFICRLMKVLQYLRHYTLKKFGNDLLVTCILFLNVRTWKTFSITSTIFMKDYYVYMKFTMEEESNGELAFLYLLLKQNNGKIFVLVYRKPTHTDQDLHYNPHHQTSFKKSVVSFLFNRAFTAYMQFYYKSTSSRVFFLQFSQFFQILGKLLGRYRV